MNISKILLLLVVVLLPDSVFAQSTPDRKALAAEVKTEFLHAWNGYKKYAWGNDDLKPLSKSFHNWYAEPLLMTPVDALDTMYIMGFKKEADETRKYITEDAQVRQGHLGPEFRDHDPLAWRTAVGISDHGRQEASRDGRRSRARVCCRFSNRRPDCRIAT